MQDIQGERGKSLRVGLYEGLPYFWIQPRVGDGWSIQLRPGSIRTDFGEGVYNGHSEGTSEPRRMTITLMGADTQVRIHLPDNESRGRMIRVSTEELRRAVADEIG